MVNYVCDKVTILHITLHVYNAQNMYLKNVTINVNIQCSSSSSLVQTASQFRHLSYACPRMSKIHCFFELYIVILNKINKIDINILVDKMTYIPAGTRYRHDVRFALYSRQSVGDAFTTSLRRYKTDALRKYMIYGMCGKRTS
jgi:hypothetical protein